MFSKEWHKVDPSTREIIQRYQIEHPIKIGELAKQLGLKVSAATLPANISGEIKEDEDGVIHIRVNRHDVKTRQRFTIAHEISHFILHRHLLRSGIQDDVLYRSNQSDKIEWEANALASDILMPAEIVKKLINEKYGDLDGEALFEAVSEELSVSPTALKYKFSRLR
ncbi:ImmA/IrrE family metallo-endopeptidase [Aeromonas intestinalis]